MDFALERCPGTSALVNQGIGSSPRDDCTCSVEYPSALKVEGCFLLHGCTLETTPPLQEIIQTQKKEYYRVPLSEVPQVGKARDSGLEVAWGQVLEK